MDIEDIVNNGKRDPGRPDHRVPNPHQVRISRAYIWELRKGAVDDPRIKHLRSLAWAFGVDSDYLTNAGVAQKVQDEIAALRELSSHGVRTVLLRTVLRDRGLTEANAQLVEDLVERLGEHQGPAGRGGRDHGPTRHE